MPDDPDFMRFREPSTGMYPRIPAILALHAEQNLGGELIPLAGAGSPEEAKDRAVDNIRRLVAMVCARARNPPALLRVKAAVDASELFCVAVSLTADEILTRRARRRPGTQRGT